VVNCPTLKNGPDEHKGNRPSLRLRPARIAAPVEPVPFGKYLLVERIAHGGMAEVFRAVYQGAAGVEKTVALKRILPGLEGMGEFVEMFVDEARIASSLTHVNIAQVFEFGEVGGSYYLAMELIEGVDLGRVGEAARRRGTTLPPMDAAFIIAEAARGLAYAHEKRGPGGALLGIVHRDVSPQNILVSWAGEVKIADFGIAKAIGKLHKTESGAVLGKLRYMSPEQVSGEPLDGRSDVFSLGIILHELLTGRTLFDGDNPGRVAEQVKLADVAPPSSRAAGVAPELDRICMKALARARDARYERAALLGRDLSRLVAERAPGLLREDVGAHVAELMGVGAAEAAARPAEAAGGDPIEAAAPARITPSSSAALGPTVPARRSAQAAPQAPGPARPAATRLALAGGLALAALGGAAALWSRIPGPASGPASGMATEVATGTGAGPPDGGAADVRQTAAATRERLVAELERLPQAEAAWRGVIAEDYLAILSAVDASLCATPPGQAEPVFSPDVAERLARRRVEPEARAVARHLLATGELPPRVAASLGSFLSAHPAYSPGETGWSLAQLAVRLAPTDARHLYDLLRENGAHRRWREAQPGVVDLCDRRQVVALYATRAPGPRASALQRYLAALPAELPRDDDGLRYAVIGAERDEAAAALDLRLRITNPGADARPLALEALRLAGIDAAPTIDPPAPSLPAGKVREVRLRFSGVTDALAEAAVLVLRPGVELQAYAEDLR
jgi:hypothetical protein